MARQNKIAQEILANARLNARGALGNVRFDIQGLEELNHELSFLPEKLTRTALTRGLQTGGKLVENQAAALAPHGRTGNLKHSISTRRRLITGRTLVAGVDVFAKRSKATPGGYYAHLVELGHDIYRTTRSGKYFIKHYTGKRFMRPALEQKREQILSVFKLEVAGALERFYAGKKRI